MRRGALIVVALLLAGCGGGSGTKSGKGFLAGLQSQGVKVTHPRPEPPGILEVPSTAYRLPGGTMHIFTFSDGPTAREAAKRVVPDGYTVRNSMGINQAVGWASTPHWYRHDRALAVYIGRSSQVTDALTAIAGKQFAGG